MIPLNKKLTAVVRTKARANRFTENLLDKKVGVKSVPLKVKTQRKPRATDLNLPATTPNDNDPLHSLRAIANNQAKINIPVRALAHQARSAFADPITFSINRWKNQGG